MHYYQFNISDWALHTSHLTLEEDAVYRRLLDFYYDTEAPLPRESAAYVRRLRLRDHADAVSEILIEFFVLEDDGWHNKRADLEIASYHAKADTARVNGAKGGRPKKTTQKEPKANPEETQPVNLANPEETGSKANHELLTKNYELGTINQELKTNNNKPKDQKTSSDKPDGAINRFDDFWQMYPRKTDKKKAKSAWDKIKPNDDLAIKIITNVSNRLASGEWVKGSQYIPHPTTYLNGSRWEDEAQAPDDNRTDREKRNEAIAADSKAKFDAGDFYDPFERIMSGNNDPSVINSNDLLEHQS